MTEMMIELNHFTHIILQAELMQLIIVAFIYIMNILIYLINLIELLFS